MPRFLVVPLFSFAVLGCLSPATRPAKIKPGFSGTVGGAILYGAVNEERCVETCRPQDVEAVNLVHFDGRWGVALSEDSSIAVGGYLASESTTKIEDSPFFGNVYLQTGYHQGPLAVSLALELGANAVGPTVTAQLFPSRDQPSASIAVYARALRPFRRRDLSERSVEVATFDAGLAVRFARVLLQYSYYSRESGLEDRSDGFETSLLARDWHIFVIGHEF